MHVGTRHEADLVPLLLDLAQRLAGLLGFLRGLDRHKGLRLLEQLLLLGEVLFLAFVHLVAIGLAGVEERVGGGAEARPQGVVLLAAGVARTLPTVHQLVELVRRLAPVRGVLDLLGLLDDLLLGGLRLGALRVTRLAPLAAARGERGASGGETLPQGVGVGLVEAHRRLLVVLPFLEHLLQLVAGITPVRVVAKAGHDLLGLLDDLRALGKGLRIGLLALLLKLLLALFAGDLQFAELLAQGLEIAHHLRLGDLGLQLLQRLADLAGLDGGGCEARGELVKLRLELQIALGVRLQRLLLLGVRILADGTLVVPVLDEHRPVVRHAAELLGIPHILVGERRRHRFHRCRCRLLGKRSRGWMGPRLGCRRLGSGGLGGGGGFIIGRGDSLFGHSHLLGGR